MCSPVSLRACQSRRHRYRPSPLPPVVQVSMLGPPPVIHRGASRISERRRHPQVERRKFEINDIHVPFN